MTRTVFVLLFLFTAMHGYSQSKGSTWYQTLNRYFAYINHAAIETERRLEILKTYYRDSGQYRKKTGTGIRLASSGPLERHYYDAARQSSGGLTAGETKALNEGLERLWEAAGQLDEQCKSLETYVRLEDYKEDGFRQSEELMQKLEILFVEFRRKEENFSKQVENVYRQYQPAGTDPYLQIDLAMRKALETEKTLLSSWSFYLSESKPGEFPLDRLQQNIAESEAVIASFSDISPEIEYPASSMVKGFQSALGNLLEAKRNALDETTYEARQSARHGNQVYLNLINHFNNDLLANYQSFVQYSGSGRRLLSFPRVVPVFTLQPANPGKAARKTAEAEPFHDVPPLAFKTHRATAPAGDATLVALNQIVDFINESLCQVSKWQALVRDYSGSVQHYRNTPETRRRSNLTYSHREVKLPLSLFGKVMGGSKSISGAYRPSVQSQAEVLMNVLREMDALSIELIGYTAGKEYERDGLRRSDEIVHRYEVLIEIFDQKKEQLYRDIRRIYESYPPVSLLDPWHLSGKALAETLDLSRQVLFGHTSNGTEQESLPGPEALEAKGRQLIADEYKNLKGLHHYGRSNGLCPYTHYENIAETAIRLARKIRGNEGVTVPPETFYNNHLVYQYNSFCDLAKPGRLKAIHQLGLFPLTPEPEVHKPRSYPPVGTYPSAISYTPLDPHQPPVQGEINSKSEAAKTSVGAEKTEIIRHDTVFIERTDTVFIVQNGKSENFYSLEGFAANNLVLLLDVSASMKAPLKMPLLKKSVKSLLQLLRPEDQVSIVVYSGKAKVVIEAASGTEVHKIAEAIDALDSDGGTDGTAGIRLAYKLANKHYIRGGNNRIVLATDGEFPVGQEILRIVETNAREDIYLTAFHFGPHATPAGSLRQLAGMGKGSCEHISPDNASLTLINEARRRIGK